jgi:hypothetical protein
MSLGKKFKKKLNEYVVGWVVGWADFVEFLKYFPIISSVLN